ncbi:MAG: FtsB family cell division protein [Bacillota bacterium]
MNIIRRNKYFILFFIILIVYFSYNYIQQEIKLNDLSQEIYNQKLKSNELDKEIKQLQDELQNIKSKKNIENLARKKLKMIKSDEILYIIQEKED